MIHMKTNVHVNFPFIKLYLQRHCATLVLIGAWSTVLSTAVALYSVLYVV